MIDLLQIKHLLSCIFIIKSIETWKILSKNLEGDAIRSTIIDKRTEGGYEITTQQWCKIASLLKHPR